MSKAAIKRGQHLAMLQAAHEAFDNPEKLSPYLAASDMDCAWRIGRWLRQTGQLRPTSIRPSYPWTYHVDNFKVHCPWARIASPWKVD